MAGQDSTTTDCSFKFNGIERRVVHTRESPALDARQVPSFSKYDWKDPLDLKSQLTQDEIRMQVLEWCVEVAPRCGVSLSHDDVEYSWHPCFFSSSHSLGWGNKPYERIALRCTFSSSGRKNGGQRSKPLHILGVARATKNQQAASEAGHSRTRF